MSASVFSAGKYFAFVWPAYAISLGALVLAVTVVWRLYRRARMRLKEFEGAADERPRNARGG